MKKNKKIDFEGIEEKLYKGYYKEVIQQVNGELYLDDLKEEDKMLLDCLLLRACFCISEYQLAIAHGFKALEKAKKLENLRIESKVYLTLVGCYGRLGDLANALSYAQEAARGYTILQDYKGLSRTYNNMGVTYLELKDMQKAKECYQKVLEYIEEDDDELRINIWMNYANIEQEEELYEQALEHLEKSIIDAKKIKNKRVLTYGYKTLAGVLEHLKEYEKAEQAISEALLIQEEINDQHEICECYMRLSSLAEKKLEFSLALVYLKKYNEIREKFLHEENKERILKIEQEYKLKEQNIYITQNKELRELNKELMEAYEKIKHLSETDFLTNVLNRRGFQAKMKRMQEEHGGDRSGYKILLVDIDYFKRINDCYGHDEGDRVLIKIAEILRGKVADKGVVGRWGGEEFIIFLPCGQEKAEEMAHEIKEAINAKRFKVEKSSIHVTVTIGISQSCQSSMEQQIKEADDNLYKGKKCGRNCVIR